MAEGDGREAMQAELGDRYEIVAKLGSGAGGETFEAVRREDGARVALKRLVLTEARDWKRVELFEREARVLRGLAHPSIPRFCESFVESSGERTALYLIHELAPGRSLRAWMQAGWHPDAAEITRIAEFLLEVLSYLHSLSPPLVHRDVKPDNVIRSEDGKLWLVDFGAVRDFTAPAAGGSTVVGTYGYMAPEQFRGHAEPATDLYGVGATVLHLLSGRPPTDFPHEKLKIVFRRETSGPPALLSWVERALEPAPEDRFESAALALAALRGAEPSRAVKRTSSGARVGFLLGVLCALLGLSGVIAALELRRARPATASAAPPAAIPTALAPLLPRPGSAYKPIRYDKAFDGHMNLVLSLAVSPDDKTLASGSDGSVKLWNIQTGQVLRSLGGHDGKVTGVLFTRDGSQLVSGGGSSIRIWDAAKGTLARTIDHPHAGVVMGLALSPDGRTLYSAGRDGVLTAWDFAKGARLRSFSHGSIVYSLALSPNGLTLASGAKDGTVKVWHTATGRLIATLEEHTSTISSLAFAPDGSLLASASDDHQIVVWSVQNATTFERYHSLEHQDEAWGVSFSPDGHLLVGSGKDGTISLTDPLNRRTLAMLNGDTLGGASVFTSDGRIMLLAARTYVYRYRVGRRGLGTKIPDPPAEQQRPADRERALFQEAMAAITLFELEEASAKLAELERADPRSQLAAIGRARLTMKRGYGDAGFSREALAKALAELEGAARLGSKGAEWWGVRAAIARAAHDLPAAHDALRAAYARVPNAPYASLIEAAVDYDEGRYEESIDVASRVLRAVRRKSLDAWAYEQLESDYEQVGDLDAAEACSKKRIETVPEDASSHTTYAWFLLQRVGDVDAAIAEADRARAISDARPARVVYATAHVERGNTLLWDRRDAQGAKHEYDAALEANPRASHAYYGRAAVYRWLAIQRHDPKLVQNAREDLQHAIANYSPYPPWKRMLAELDQVEAFTRSKAH